MTPFERRCTSNLEHARKELNRKAFEYYSPRVAPQVGGAALQRTADHFGHAFFQALPPLDLETNLDLYVFLCVFGFIMVEGNQIASKTIENMQKPGASLCDDDQGALGQTLRLFRLQRPERRGGRVGYFVCFMRTIAQEFKTLVDTMAPSSVRKLAQYLDIPVNTVKLVLENAKQRGPKYMDEKLADTSMRLWSRR